MLEEALAASNRNSAAINIQKLLSHRIRDLGTVAAWKSRRKGKKDQCEAQLACAKEFQKLKASVIKGCNSDGKALVGLKAGSGR